MAEKRDKTEDVVLKLWQVEVLQGQGLAVADTVPQVGVTVHIANLDCAERGTSVGERATKRAKQLLANQTVQCRLEGRRSYDREVGICALEDGRSFGQVMIAEGCCSRWRRESPKAAMA